MSNLSRSNGGQPELARVIGLINHEVRKLLPLQRMSTKQQKVFSVDLALISLAVRTAYLVDTVAPPNAVEVFSELLSCLRLKSPLFESVVHVYEMASDQSFFVHFPLLLEKRYLDSASTGCHARGKIIFVCLKRDGPEISTIPPSGLAPALQSLLMTRSYLPTSITLPAELAPETTVPLAALLLEYPVAYVPSSDIRVPFLDNVQLDVYECTLVTENDQTHPLVKFSCPSNLAEAYPDGLGASHIVAYLREKFEGRLKKSVQGATLRITHSREAKDRLAL